MNDAAIEREIKRRAKEQVGRRHLVVDYYRIRYRWAFPLPIAGRQAFTKMNCRGDNSPPYPWDVWFMWALEERVDSLGWAAEFFNDAAARAKALADLEALAGWPPFAPPQWHGLSVGHYLRILCTAREKWGFLSDILRQKIDQTLKSSVENAQPWIDQTFATSLAAGVTVEALCATPKSEMLIHNIKLIALVGWAMAGNLLALPEAQRMNSLVRFTIDVLIHLRRRGITEAVAYNGYLLDFIACWMDTLPPQERDQIAGRAEWDEFLNESIYLSAPGDVSAVAEMSDVEPIEMPFHATPQARMQHWHPEPIRAWYLKRWPIERLPAEALAQLRGLPDEPADEPPSGALDAYYIKVMRSGWQKRDLAVAVAASTCPMGHIHLDYGSIVIGTDGQWLLADPGYQQYHETSERVFTMGPAAHNVPLVNGHAMTQKAGRVMFFGENDRGSLEMRLDLTKCFPAEAGVRSARRTVWLAGRRGVVIADEIEADKPESLEYHWHSHRQAAWHVQEGQGSAGAAMIYLPPDSLWVRSPQVPEFSRAMVDRSRGSRGHLTLTAKLPPSPIVWWVFAPGEAPPAVDPGGDARQIKVFGKKFIAG